MAAEIIGVVLQPIIDNLVIPIGRQFDYLLNYRRYISDIETRLEKLQKIRQGVEQSVKAARRDLQEIGFHVKHWLEETAEITKDVENILSKKTDVEKRCLKGWCPNLKARYLISRKSRKEITEVDRLIDEGKGFLRVTYPSGPIVHVPIHTESTIRDFESRRSIENQVITALEDVGIFSVGLCGMGGVGKTTMAIKISKISKVKNMFDEIVFVSVTHKLDEMKVQSDLGQGLGLTLDTDNVSVRAGRLCARIIDTRKILIIIDDVWNQFDLNKIGIPSKGMHKGCKILLTSRLRDTCDTIGVERIFTISELPEIEAWILFKEKAGKCVEKTQLVSTAKDVMKECKGLPIAIVTVAKSLKDQSNKAVWEDALLQLRRSLPQNILLSVMNQVYLPLELSFESLETDEVKTFFLICSLFPEDSYIPIDTLVRFGIGLGIFSGVESLIEARNRAHSLVKLLRDRSLLIDTNDEIVDEEHYIQIHDVIRDVALFIASKGRCGHAFLVSHNPNSNEWPRRKSYDHFTCISVISRAFSDLPERLDCPKLEMLLLDCNQQGLNVADTFFSGMKELKVLELQEFRIESFPTSFKALTNLTTLHIHYCEFVNKTSDKLLSFITEMVNLEIVSLRYSNIKILPAGIGNLRNLRLLDVTGCRELNVIPTGTLSRLTRLEELYLKWSFTSWGTRTEGRRLNASLNELESLSKLTSLELVIPDLKGIPMDLRVSQTLTRYEILVGMPVGTTSPKDIRKRFKKIVCMNLDSPQPMISPSIKKMMSNAEYLYSRGDGSISAIESINKVGFKNLKQLHVSDCSTLHRLANREAMDGEFKVFPSLEKMVLEKLPSLRELWNGETKPSGSGSFSKLKILEIKKLPKLMHLWKSPNQDVSLSNLVSLYLDECDRLQDLFSQSVAQSLVLLENLKVMKCKRMQEIISNDQGEKPEKLVKFPRLNDLELNTLDELTGFCRNAAGIQLKQLRHLKINALPKLKSFQGETKEVNSGEAIDINVPSLFDNKIEFLCLTILQIHELAANQLYSQNISNGSFKELELLQLSSIHNLKNLCTSSVAKGLSKLKELVIQNCSKMEEVVQIDRNENQKNEMVSLFPELETLKLGMMEELKRFSQVKNELEMKLLEYVEIKSCPNLRTFNEGILSTPSLKVLRIDDHDMQITQLNSVLQHEYQKNHAEIEPKKTFFTISASDLVMDSGDWTWPIEQEENGESFVVAELHKAAHLEVWGKLENSKLVLGLTYEVVFVIMLREPVRGWEEAVNLRLILPNGGIIDKKESFKTKPRRRYIEIKVGEFKALEEDNEGDIEFGMIQQNKNVVKRGLVVKGALVRQKPQLVQNE